jgi:pimeloyl-ACP methyl ester carboxylesterase
MVRNFQLFCFLLLGSLLFSNCKSNIGESPTDQTRDQYLVSYTFVKSISQTEVNAMFSPYQSIYPDVTAILPYVKSGAKVYSVTYNTVLGTKNLVASGLVSIPDGGGTYPILSFQNGTNTVNANAPSLNPNAYMSQMITGFSTTGFVVIMPDYLGFGSSTQVFHPYLHMESTVTSIRDLFRAVKEMSNKPELNLKLSPDLYLMGYSQGGLSTAQLHKTIETNYSSEFNLKGVGCGAGPYNLSLITEMVVNATTYSQPYYIAYIMKGFKSAGAYPNPYSDIFNEPYASRLDGLFNGVNSGSYINDQLSTNMSQLFTNEIRSTFSTNTKFRELRDALTASSIYAWRIKTPLILTHGQADIDVSPAMSKQLYDDMIKLDPALPVTYIPLAGMDHGLAAAPSVITFVKRFLTIKGQ